MERGERVLARWVLPIVFTLLAIAGGAAPPTAAVREVVVAAAADLKFALDEIVSAFQAEQPDISVKVSYGSSGNFFAQLSNRAPFDMFFSADAEYPRRLKEAGLAAADTEFRYAVGRIVLWVPRASGLDVEKDGLRSLSAPGVRRVAIANPRHAPYGRAAEAAMRKLGVYEAVEGKLVFGENVAQAAQFVESGAADAGIIALSLALAPSMKEAGRYWEVPLAAYPRMDQGGVVLGWARDGAAARALRAFVLGPKGRAILERWGFFLPEN